MNERRKFLSLAGLAAALTGMVLPQKASAVDAEQIGYRAAGGSDLWKPNQKYTARDRALTVHARIEAKNRGQAGQLLGVVHTPGGSHIVASTSVFLDEKGKGVPHNSLCISVPKGASFEIKLEGNIEVDAVWISACG